MTDSADWEKTGPTWKRHAEQVAGQSWPAGCLYVVATPIGNLGDLSLRAWEALRRCDAIAAEDTRTTRALLDAWGIDTPLLAAHRHNEREAAGAVIRRLSLGERIALVSDAGAPAVSDPGARVVREVQAAGYRVVPLPGPSAVVAALMASGATRDDAPGFAFAGFMPSKAQARRKWLDQWLAWPVPVVMFETPHRLRAALMDLSMAAGPDRRVTVARELSKRFGKSGRWRRAMPSPGWTRTLTGNRGSSCWWCMPTSRRASRTRTCHPSNAGSWKRCWRNCRCATRRGSAPGPRAWRVTGCTPGPWRRHESGRRSVPAD